MRKTSRGFTLIEVLVALTILGLALGGLYSSVSQQTDQRLRLSNRFMGQTAAWNREQCKDNKGNDDLYQRKTRRLF